MEVQVVSYIHKTFKSARSIFAAIWYFSITKHGIQGYATGMSSTNNTLKLSCMVWRSSFTTRGKWIPSPLAQIRLNALNLRYHSYQSSDDQAIIISWLFKIQTNASSRNTMS